jgi:transposase
VGKKAAKVTLTSKQRAVLEPMARARTAPQRLVERCRIVLMSAEDRDNEDLAEELGVDRQRVRRWRSRWASASAALVAAEEKGATDRDLEELILAVLADDERSGAPARFTPEQVAGIIALACEPPAESGLPVSHWTPAELAREAIERAIVVSISPRHVDRFLARRTSGRTRASTG